MPSCVALGCLNRSGKRGKGRKGPVSYYAFPVGDDIKFDHWKGHMGRNDINITKNSCLCEDHFEEKMFNFVETFSSSHRIQKRLIKSAVPRKFFLNSSGEWEVGPPTKKKAQNVNRQPRSGACIQPIQKETNTEVIVIDDGESLAAKRPRRKASIPAQEKVAALARSEENLDDDDDVVIVSETRVAPRRNTTPQHRGPGRPRGPVATHQKTSSPAVVQRSRARSVRHTSFEVDLNMECVEEALSPYQIQANKRAEQEYNDAVAKIKAAQAKIAAEQQAQIAEQRRQRKQQLQLQAQRQQEILLQQQQKKQAQQPISIAPKAPFQNVSNSDLTRDPQPSQAVYPYGQAQNALTGNTGALYSNIYSPAKPQGAAVRPPVWTSRAQQESNRSQLTIINPVSLSTNPAAKPVETIVPRTHGLGVKRPGKDLSVERTAKRRSSTGSGSSSNSTGKKSTTESGSWVPLDEYYYGKKEGDPTYREEKGEFRFKCWYCHKMLYNNLRMMFHMQSHIDSEKQQNLDLADLTQCKHCFKQFDTPFDMQCHIERVHQNKGNVLVCRICDKDHDNQAALRQHMRNYHSACEMPYICQLCNFRSSVYSDVVDHFKKRHDSSQHTLCLYCLRVFKINFSKNSGWGLTQNYYQHIQKHQVSNKKKKCPCCKLTFLSPLDVKSHKSKDHLPNHKGAGLKASGTPSQDQVMIQLTDASSKVGNKPKSLNAQSVSKVRDLRGIRIVSNTLYGKICLECKFPMEQLDHFKRYVECSMCRYATTCNNAYSNHMISFHSGNQLMKNKAAPKERPMDQEMFCLCGFSSKLGNSIANHLVFCSKRTSYSNKPEPKWFEYDDEQEEFNPFEPYVEEPDVPDVETPGKDRELTLLGVLGLVKKKADSSSPEPEEVSSEKVVDGVIDSLLEAVFPAEAAVGEAIDQVMEKVNKHITLKSRQQEDDDWRRERAQKKEEKQSQKRFSATSRLDKYMLPTKKRKTSHHEHKSPSKESLSESTESKSLETDEPMEVCEKSPSSKEETSGAAGSEADEVKSQLDSEADNQEALTEEKESSDEKEEPMETDEREEILDSGSKSEDFKNSTADEEVDKSEEDGLDISLNERNTSDVVKLTEANVEVAKSPSGDKSVDSQTDAVEKVLKEEDDAISNTSDQEIRTDIIEEVKREKEDDGVIKTSDQVDELKKGEQDDAISNISDQEIRKDGVEEVKKEEDDTVNKVKDKEIRTNVGEEVKKEESDDANDKTRDTEIRTDVVWEGNKEEKDDAVSNVKDEEIKSDDELLQSSPAAEPEDNSEEKSSNVDPKDIEPSQDVDEDKVCDVPCEGGAAKEDGKEDKSDPKKSADSEMYTHKQHKSLKEPQDLTCPGGDVVLKESSGVCDVEKISLPDSEDGDNAVETQPDSHLGDVGVVEEAKEDKDVAVEDSIKERDDQEVKDEGENKSDESEEVKEEKEPEESSPSPEKTDAEEKTHTNLSGEVGEEKKIQSVEKDPYFSGKEPEPEESLPHSREQSARHEEENIAATQSPHQIPVREMSAVEGRTEVQRDSPLPSRIEEIIKKLPAHEEERTSKPSSSTQHAQAKPSDQTRPLPTTHAQPAAPSSALAKSKDRPTTESSRPREAEQSRSSKTTSHSSQSHSGQSQDNRRRDDYRSSSHSNRYDDRRHGYRDDRGYRDDHRDNRQGGRNWYDQRQGGHDNRQGRYDDRQYRGHHGHNRGGYGGHDRHDRRDYNNHGNNRGNRGRYGNQGGGSNYGGQGRYQGGYY